jgi:hypothetical protein
MTTLLDIHHPRPLASWRDYGKERGMSLGRDVVDCIGRWPFEVATPEAIFHSYSERCSLPLELVFLKNKR